MKLCISCAGRALNPARAAKRASLSTITLPFSKEARLFECFLMSDRIEFSRRFLFNRLGSGAEETITANEAERQALARRFGIPAVDALRCHFRLKPMGNGRVVRHVHAEGTLEARVTQVCVITAETFDVALSEPFQLNFVPESELPDDDLEFDIDSIDLDAPDDVPHDGKALDLGEAAAEQLALMLDPYPRKLGAELDNAVDVTPSDEELKAAQENGKGTGEGSGRPNPFAALTSLRKGGKLD